MSTKERLRKAVPLKMRRRFVSARHSARAQTASQRALPTFMVIGTQRGGTSSLFRYLSGHPDVERPLRKETEYFSGRYDEGLDWYRAHFPTTRSLKKADGSSKVTFEATPDYLFDPRAARHAIDTLPQARLVVLLREPAARTFSQYRHMVRLGFEDLPFGEALDAEADRCAADIERVAEHDTYRPPMLLRYAYTRRSHYETQLPAWLEAYGRDMIHIVTSERFFQRPRDVFGEILQFLELEAWQPEDMPNHSFSDDTDRGVPPAQLDRLEAEFQGTYDEIDELIGFESGWKR